MGVGAAPNLSPIPSPLAEKGANRRRSRRLNLLELRGSKLARMGLTLIESIIELICSLQEFHPHSPFPRANGLN